MCNMLVEEDAVTIYLVNGNGTFAEMMCAILGPYCAIQYHTEALGLIVSLSEGGPDVVRRRELPNLVNLMLMEDNETNLHVARCMMLARNCSPSVGRFVRLSNEYPRIQHQYPCDIHGFLGFFVL